MALSAREKMKKDLKLRNRIDEAQKTGNRSIFTQNRYFEVPEGIELWRPKSAKKGDKVGHHEIDIIPFEVGSHYPTENEYGDLREGDFHYLLDLKIHRNVGPENLWVICPYANYKLPCPICEHAKELYAAADSEAETKKITQDKYPKRRNIFNVWVHDTPEEEAKGIQIWEDAYFFVGKNLEEEANKNPDGDGKIAFYYLNNEDGGRRVSFDIVQKAEKEIEYASFFLKKRKEDIPDVIADSAICLDDLIAKKLLSYDELKDLYWGNGGKSEPRARKEKTESNEGTRGRRDPEENKEPESKPEKEAEPTRRRSLGRKPVEEVAPEEETEVVANRCPAGHIFGVEYAKQSHLRDCEEICDDASCMACEEEAENLKKPKVEEVAPPPRRRSLGRK